MKILFSTLLSAFLFSSLNFGQWIEYNSFTSETLFGIYFADQQTGWANGGWSYSKLFKTNNSGDSWELILEEPNISNVYSTDVNKVFISVYDGLSYSSDGGTSWNFTNFNYSGVNIGCIDFVDQNNGWVCANHILFFTKNAGITWNESAPFPNDGSFGANLISVSFVDSLRGWVLRENGNIYSSIDGGNSWLKKGNVESSSFTNNNGIYFADSLIGFVIGFNGVSKTTDGGANWSIFEDSQNKEIFSFHFLNKNIGWIGGQKGLFKTTDGGENWLIQYYGKTIQSIHFLNEDVGWASGNDGLLLFTANGGGDTIFVSVEYETNQIDNWRLEQNFPNPFNPTTIINYNIPQRSYVSLKVYDVLGIEIRTLVNQENSVGIHKVEFNAEGLSSGVYFYKLETSNYSETKKMLLMR